MIDPIFHGTARPFLPDDHWLFTHWPEHDDDSDVLSCSRCGNAVYSRATGTIRDWFETGFVLEEADGEFEAHLFCHTCSANMGYWIPSVDERYWLNDDGTPQFDKARPEGAAWGGTNE